MRLGARVCGTDIHWHAAARSGRGGQHIGALEVVRGSLGIDNEELLGPSHTVYQIAEIKICVPGNSLQVHLLQDCYEHTEVHA